VNIKCSKRWTNSIQNTLLIGYKTNGIKQTIKNKHTQETISYYPIDIYRTPSDTFQNFLGEIETTINDMVDGYWVKSITYDIEPSLSQNVQFPFASPTRAEVFDRLLDKGMLITKDVNDNVVISSSETFASSIRESQNLQDYIGDKFKPENGE